MSENKKVARESRAAGRCRIAEGAVPGRGHRPPGFRLAPRGAGNQRQCCRHHRKPDHRWQWRRLRSAADAYARRRAPTGRTTRWIRRDSNSVINYGRGEQFYNGLTRIDGFLVAQPDLAESWEPNANATEWVFRPAQRCRVSFRQVSACRRCRSTPSSAIWTRDVGSGAKAFVENVAEGIVEGQAHGAIQVERSRRGLSGHPRHIPDENRCRWEQPTSPPRPAPAPSSSWSSNPACDPWRTAIPITGKRPALIWTRSNGSASRITTRA